GGVTAGGVGGATGGAAGGVGAGCSTPTGGLAGGVLGAGAGVSAGRVPGPVPGAWPFETGVGVAGVAASRTIAVLRCACDALTGATATFRTATTSAERCRGITLTAPPTPAPITSVAAATCAAVP